MEKFQMLFPTSSSSSSSTQYYDHHHHHDHHNSINFLSSSSPPSMNRGRDGPLMMTMRTSAADHQEEEEEEEEEEEQGVTVEAGAADRGEKKKKKVKQARFAFQTRSQVDILDDGYRWRKYGQKAVKNNKFPRSYYRCTYQGCNVKKQVQRLTRDEGVVVTTYEGVHTHPIEKPTDNFEHILSRMQIYSTPV